MKSHLVSFTLLTTLAVSCGRDKKDNSRPAPVQAQGTQTGTIKSQPAPEKVSYNFNLVAKGTCLQTGRRLTLNYFANGQYTVSDDADTFNTKSGAYSYVKETGTFTLKPAAFAPNDPAFLDGSCFERAGIFECAFNGGAQLRIDCSNATFGDFAPVQQKINECEAR